ncbi:hypothetical protein GH714_020881 [Hevea brasiliensis]|uniref:Uncharacterized protein n=1 Tax=Hevea brasiliensis TaxID=3981 RepID=A0A6A6LDT4_HEVBR|nr:hypothetical protein GH714_020881 [Hevea brasiliensis]
MAGNMGGNGIFSQTGLPGELESNWVLLEQMRLSVRARAQNEVHCRHLACWAEERPKTRFRRPSVVSEHRFAIGVIISDLSEVIPGTSVAPGGEEQGGGRRKGRGKSRDPGRAREELGDFEARLAKVGLHLIEGEEKFEEMDTHLEELDGKMEELHEELRGALDSAVDKLASEGESLRLSHLDNYAALRDENRSLREQVDRVVDENTHLREELDKVLGKLKEVEQQVSLVAIAVVQEEGPMLRGLPWLCPLV